LHQARQAASQPNLSPGWLFLCFSGLENGPWNTGLTGIPSLVSGEDSPRHSAQVYNE